MSQENVNKRILYISYDGMTDPLGQSQVIPYLRELSKLGYRFTVISFEKKEKLEKTRPVIEKLMREASITWKPKLFSRRPPILSKIYDKYQMKKLVSKLHRHENFHMVHCRSYIAAEAGLMLYRKHNVPYLFDMRGFWVDERVDNGQWDLKKIIYRQAYDLYKKKEKVLFANAAHIISLTYKGREELVKNYSVPAEKITVIPCCVDLDHFDYRKIDPSTTQAIRHTLGIAPGDRVLGYLGSLGGWYLTKDMLEFYALFRQQIGPVKFLFLTHDKKEGIVAAAERAGIPGNEIIATPATRNEVPSFLSVCDWNIFFIKDAYSKKASSPTKQGEIMAMGIPIVCNDIGDTGQIVIDTGAGIVIEDFTSQGYTKAIEGLLGTINFDKASIRTGASEYYDLNVGRERYDEVYKKITQ